VLSPFITKPSEIPRIICQLSRSPQPACLSLGPEPQGNHSVSAASALCPAWGPVLLLPQLALASFLSSLFF
jgi:hypothetical protein